MAYTPEPTHPLRVRQSEGLGGDEVGTDPDHTAQLQREFENIRNALNQTNDVITGALPWKAFNLILDGQGGLINGVANATLPTTLDFYNVDQTVNGGAGLVRTGEGVYVFTLLIAQIAGIDILPVLYPSFTVLLGGTNNPDPSTEGIRVLLTDADVPSGTFEITIQQQEVPPSGKALWEPYDLRDTTGQTPDTDQTVGQDRLWATGTLNLSSAAEGFSDTP